MTDKIHGGTLRRKAADIFRREYAATRRAALDDNRLLWSQAVAFVRLALSALGQLKAGWPARVRGHLGRAEAMLDARAGWSRRVRLGASGAAQAETEG